MDKHCLLSWIAAVAVLLIPLHRAQAHVPETVHYQGRVFVDGTPFSGEGLFKFALVDDGLQNVSVATATAVLTGSFVTSITVDQPGSGYTSPPEVAIEGEATAVAIVENGQVTGFEVLTAGSGYTEAPLVTIAPPPRQYETFWSHDGTSLEGAAPVGFVALPVSDGVFSVALGGNGMEAITPEVLADTPLELRVWFEGGNGWQQLSPDQPLTSVPYALRTKSALHAQTVADGAISASQIDPAIGVWERGMHGFSTTENVSIGTTDQTVQLQVVGSFVSGSVHSSATAFNSFVGGGSSNHAAASYSFVGGGQGNQANGPYSFVGGGDRNQANGSDSFVAGGMFNHTNGVCSFIGGGDSNRTNGDFSFVAGGTNNEANGFRSFAAGRRAKAEHNNTFVWADGTDSDFATTAANQFLIRAGGGVRINTNVAKPGVALLVNGSVVTGSPDSTASGANSFAAGVLNTASGASSFIAGGNENAASGLRGFVGGGTWNAANGTNSFVAGGDGNRASGTNSFAAGRAGRALHNGTFVWGDDRQGEFASTGSNQFLIRAQGGVGIGTNSPQRALHVKDTNSSAAIILENAAGVDGWGIGTGTGTSNFNFYYNEDVSNFTTGGTRLGGINHTSGVYSSNSDRRLKQDIENLEDVLDGVLALQPTTYRFQRAGEDGPRNYGFIAQEVQEVFPDLVTTDPSDGYLNLAYSEFSVLSIRAIQEQQALIDAQAEEIQNLTARLARIEALLGDGASLGAE